jgi:hypothetical protein
MQVAFLGPDFATVVEEVVRKGDGSEMSAFAGEFGEELVLPCEYHPTPLLLGNAA